MAVRNNQAFRNRTVLNHWERQREIGRLYSLPTRLPVHWATASGRWIGVDGEPIPFHVRWHYLCMIQECGARGYLDGRMPIRDALCASELGDREAKQALLLLDATDLIWLADDRSECQVYDLEQFLPAAKDARPWIHPTVRQAVYDRDGGKCVQCGSEKDLTLDHIHPYSLGGSDDQSNLQTMCRRCNSRKGARLKQESAESNALEVS